MASCKPTALMSVFWSAAVMYMWISRNRSSILPFSAWLKMTVQQFIVKNNLSSTIETFFIAESFSIFLLHYSLLRLAKQSIKSYQVTYKSAANQFSVLQIVLYSSHFRKKIQNMVDLNTNGMLFYDKNCLCKDRLNLKPDQSHNYPVSTWFEH